MSGHLPPLSRKFLRSTWGWTCILTGSFVLLLSFSACRSVPVSLRHFSRIGLAGLLWWGTRRLLTLLEDAAGSCYEPMPPAQDVQTPAAAAQPPLLLHEDQTKASCLRANLLWRGYEVSQNVLILCLCCLLLLEEISVFGRHLSHEKRQQRSPGAPIRILFLLCVVLLIMWMFLLLCLLANFPNWPSQQLGGALGYLGWRGLYQGWYRLNPRWCCPGLPGEELFITSDSVKEPKRLWRMFFKVRRARHSRGIMLLYFVIQTKMLAQGENENFLFFSCKRLGIVITVSCYTCCVKASLSRWELSHLLWASWSCRSSC